MVTSSGCMADYTSFRYFHIVGTANDSTVGTYMYMYMNMLVSICCLDCIHCRVHVGDINPLFPLSAVV